MLVFVIALKSPKVSSSWDLVSKLFERCVKSICSQTCQEFQIVVTCHEKPNIDFTSPKLHYLEVDFPIPSSNMLSRELDKGRKLLKGLAYAEIFSPSHVMIVDADDCMSRNIAKHVNENPNSPGWFINKGYVYGEGEKFIYLRPKAFSGFCGSGVIVRYDFYHQLFKDEIYNHKITSVGNNIHLEPLPFPGAVYITRSGENMYLNNYRHSQLQSKLKNKGYIYFLRDIIQYKILTNKIRQEFGLFKIA